MPGLSTQLLEQLESIAKSYIGDKAGYSFEEFIDSGGSAAVYKINTPQGFRALKICNPDFLTGESSDAEKNRIFLQRRLIDKPCPYIADTYAVEIDETCVIEMEYMPWDSLKKKLKDIPEENIHSLILQLVAAVKHLESLGLVHRDIKPENILISPDLTNLKLIDFGVVRDTSAYGDNLYLTDNGRKKPFLATAQYSSPEYLFRLVEPSEMLWKGLTIYQVGAVLFDLLTKTPIFFEEIESANRFVLAMAVLRKTPSLDSIANPSLMKLKRLALNCLTKNLQARVALVDWAHFDQEDDPPLKKLKLILSQKKQLASTAFDNGQKIYSSQEAQLNKHKSLVGLYDALRANLIQELGDYVKLDALSPKENSTSFELLICLTSGVPDLLVRISFEWGEEDESETAKTYIQTRNPKNENPSLWDGAPKIMGITHFSGSGQTELVINISEEIAKIIATNI